MLSVFGVLSLASNYLLNKFSAKNCLIFSLTCLVLFLLVSIVLIISNTRNALIFSAVMQLFAIGSVFPLHKLWPEAFEVIPEAKAHISALILSTRLITTALGLQIAGYFYRGNASSTILVMCFGLLLFFIVGAQVFNKDKKLLLK
ncbi:hypothetical protein N3Z16_10815 (plasmid) [Candidatus Megaera polyxenophila]|nr:hypothetical protein N3Z16_10815 [Candidatus Megaera polyxenophila]